MQALARDDSLRRLLLREPRGSVAVHANLIVPSTREDCAAGYIIMEPTEYPAMSGSNTICVATVLLETGHGRDGASRRRRFGSRRPAGVVEVTARCKRRQMRERRVHERRRASPTASTRSSRSTGIGTLTVDVAFGGMWYAIADAQALGFALEPSEARELSLVGERSASRRASSCRARIRRTRRSPG